MTYAEAVNGFRRTYLREALQRNGGNVCRAAKDVGLHRNTFWTALRRLGIRPGAFRRAA